MRSDIFANVVQFVWLTLLIINGRFATTRGGSSPDNCETAELVLVFR